MLGILLRNKFKIIIFGFTRGSTGSRAGRYIGVFFGTIIFFIIAYFFIRFVNFVNSALGTDLASLVFDKILDLSFGVIFILIFFTGIATSLFVLYMSRDLELLMSFPLSSRTVFSYKFIEAMFSNSIIIFIFIFPVLIGYGVSSRLPFFYYPVMVITFICVLAVPTSIGILVGLVAVRYINPGKAKEIIATIGGLFAVAIIIGSQLIGRYLKGNSSRFDAMGASDTIRSAINSFDRPFLDYLPSTWGANALFYFHEGRFGLFGLNFFYIIISSAVLVFLCIFLSKNFYYSGWSSTNHNISGIRAGNKRKVYSGSISNLKILGGINYIIIKDFKVLFRDVRQLLNIFLPIVIFGVLFFISPLDGISDSTGGFFIDTNTLLFLFLPLFITGVITTNIAGNSIGGEELNFWLMKALPVLPKKLIKIKIAFSLIISSTAGTLVVIALYLLYRPGLIYLLFGFILMVFFCWGEASIGTAVSAFFPDFKPPHSKKSNMTFLGGILTFIFFIVYLASFGGIVVGSLFLGNFLGWPGIISILLVLALEVIINIILYNLLINLSAFRLKNMEWNY